MNRDYDERRENETSSSEVAVGCFSRSGSLRHSAINSRRSNTSDSVPLSRHHRTEADVQETLNQVSHQLSKLPDKWMTNESLKTVTPARESRLQKEESIDSLTKLSAARIRSERKLIKATPSKELMVQLQSPPLMYAAAMSHDWVNVACRTITHPSEANHVDEVDGTTALHLLVISRASYANCISVDGQSIRRIWQECKLPANLDLIRALAKLSPHALKRRCEKLGYTPLMYALLQPRIDIYDKDMQDLIQLLVECDEGTIRVPARNRRSPLELYIASYSQLNATLMFPTTSDEEAAQKSTSILSFLLERDSSYRKKTKQSQVASAGIGSLLEVLYESNSSSILHAAECASISSGRNNTLAMSELNGWWVWQWLLVLLRHCISDELESQHFSPTHAAAALDNGCPLPLLMLLMRAFPIQVRIPCPMTNTNRFILHSVCCWGGTEPTTDDGMNYSRKQMAISATIREFPSAAAVTDVEGRTALCLALRHRTLWNGGVSKLYKAFPGALHLVDPQTGLYAFMTAATAQPQMKDARKSAGKSAYKDTSQLETIFELLRAAPQVLLSSLDDDNEESVSFLEFRRAAEQQSLALILQNWPGGGGGEQQQQQQQPPSRID